MSTPASELLTFLHAVWPAIPAGHWLLFWGAPSKRSSWAQSITPEVIEHLQVRGKTENVYLGCATRGANLGPNERGKLADCQAIPGLWLDLDYGTDHKKPNLPATEEDARQLLDSMGLAPSILVHSGRGLQAWWLFREPWIFESDDDRTKAEVLTKAWNTTLRQKASTHQWDADSTWDLPRVMRLPGLWNRKGVPIPTRIVSITEDRYDPSDFDAFLTVPTEAPTETAAPVSFQLTLNPGAEPPADKFMLLAEIDQLFKLSWQQARKDFQDQSASTYDLALASRAIAAQWSPQEIVNLLIAFRRKHGHDLKLRQDYFELTLNKAMSGKQVQDRQSLLDDLKAGKPLPEHITKDPAEILSIVSERLGVTITKFVRFLSEQNTYRMEVNGKTVDIPTIDGIESQSAFRRILLDHTDHRILKFKDDAWGNLLSTLFRAIENVTVQAAKNQGAYDNYVEQYLTSNPGAIRHEDGWQEACLVGAPFVHKGWVWIVSNGFLKYLHTVWNERMTAAVLSVTLTKLGYQHEQKTIKTAKVPKTSRSCWRIREA